MSCDVGEATERLENEHWQDTIFSIPVTTYIMGGSPGDVSEEPVTQEKRKKGCRMCCDVGKAAEGLENEL